MILTIVRLVLETLSKSDLAATEDIDRTYTLVGAGWSTVSASIWVQSMDPDDADVFVKVTLVPARAQLKQLPSPDLLSVLLLFRQVARL